MMVSSLPFIHILYISSHADAVNGIIGGLGYIDDGDNDGADLLGFLNGLIAASSSGLPASVISAAYTAKGALMATQVYFARSTTTDHRVCGEV